MMSPILCTINRPDGCVIPLGPVINTEVENKGGYTLNYNEFIVYDTSQVCYHSNMYHPSNPLCLLCTFLLNLI